MMQCNKRSVALASKHTFLHVETKEGFLAGLKNKLELIGTCAEQCLLAKKKASLIRCSKISNINWQSNYSKSETKLFLFLHLHLFWCFLGMWKLRNFFKATEIQKCQSILNIRKSSKNYRYLFFSKFPALLSSHQHRVYYSRANLRVILGTFSARSRNLL